MPAGCGGPWGLGTPLTLASSYSHPVTDSHGDYRARIEAAFNPNADASVSPGATWQRRGPAHPLQRAVRAGLGMPPLAAAASSGTLGCNS